MEPLLGNQRRCGTHGGAACVASVSSISSSTSTSPIEEVCKASGNGLISGKADHFGTSIALAPTAEAPRVTNPAMALTVEASQRLPSGDEVFLRNRIASCDLHLAKM